VVEATIIERMETQPFGMEVVKLEVSDGETYLSRRFSKIYAAIATFNFANAEFTNEIISVDDANFGSGYVTLEIVGTDSTDVPVSLVIFGKV